MPDTYSYSATLDRVIDGDTVVLIVDLGFRLTAKLPMRLFGLNCAEHTTPSGKAATDYTTAWFVPGDTLTVVTQKDPEKYGRWLATITSSTGKVLNDDLISSGHAAAWSGKGPRPVPPPP